MKSPFSCRALVLVLLVCFLLPPAGAWSQAPDGAEFSVAAAGQALDKIEERLKQEDALILDRLTELETTAADIQAKSKVSVEQQRTALDEVNDSLEAVGEALPGESKEMRQQRKELTQKKALVEKRLAESRLIVVRTDQLRTQISSQRRQVVAQQLLHRGSPGWALFQEGAPKEAPGWRQTGRLLLEHSGLEQLGGERLAHYGLLLLLGGGLGWLLQRPLRRHACGLGNARPLPAFWQGVLLAAARSLPFSLGLLLAGVLAAVQGAWAEQSVLVLLLPAMLLHMGGMLPVRAFLRPTPPAVRLHQCPAVVANRLFLRLQTVCFVLFASFFLYQAGILNELPGEPLQLGRLAFVTLLCLLLLWLVWPIKHLPRFAAIANRVRAALTAGFLAITVLAWLGYTNLSLYILQGGVGTVVLLAIFSGVNLLLRQLFYGLGHGRPRQAAKEGSREEQKIDKSFSWLLLITRLLLLLVLGLALLRLWGASQSLLKSVQIFLVEGFPLGEVTIIPARIASGILVFILLWALSSWVKSKLEKEWLCDAHLAPGAEETLVTLLGYVGFILAILAGLSVSGVDFTGLAVIAGALSVGIGFGMQNIVNNFVSGLILLFERPIKKGDWIVVGETQGYVQKISVRSTLIQTFDRADVIVPNSELISTQVTNLMLNDTWGRVRVPVSVAYGSDTELVRQVLTGVMQAHPRIIKDPQVPPGPQVLFMGFGESSLDFELRCFIRDISLILVVKSDLLFGIDAAFRSNGIEVPYPKRDLYVREMPPSWRAAPNPPETSLLRGDCHFWENDNSSPVSIRNQEPAVHREDGHGTI